VLALELLESVCEENEKCGQQRTRLKKRKERRKKKGRRLPLLTFLLVIAQREINRLRGPKEEGESEDDLDHD